MYSAMVRTVAGAKMNNIALLIEVRHPMELADGRLPKGTSGVCVVGVDSGRFEVRWHQLSATLEILVIKPLTPCVQSYCCTDSQSSV